MLTNKLSQGAVVWITGLPSSGKTTLADGIVSAMRARGLPVVWLDSDELRAVMTPDATYSDHERDVFYRSLGYFAKLVSDGGALAVVSATAMKRRYRDQVRDMVPRFAEVWLHCDAHELLRRDSKGLYRGADRGELHNVPGIDAAYEPPDNAELVLDSHAHSPAELVDAACRWIDQWHLTRTDKVA